MSRRPLTHSRNVSFQKVSKPARRAGWLSRLLSRASVAGLGANHGYDMEALEQRTMLMAFNDFGTGAAQNFVFFTGQSQVAQITYFDVNFEAIAAFVNPTTGAAVLADPVQANTPEPALGGNIYKIYVTESNPDSYITIETLNGLKAPQTPEPFTGAIPPLAVTNAQTGAPAAAPIPAGTGGILIGAVDPTTKPFPNTPITSIPLTIAPFGGQPIGALVTPGIEVVPTDLATGLQNDFGQFFVGGTVTGTVEFGGNLDEFYAGAVLTGDIDGDPAIPFTAPTSARTDPFNFYVAGDLREFVTDGPVGTDAVLTKITDPSSIQYNTSFDLNVGGKLGEMRVGETAGGGIAGGAFAGTIEVGNSPYISGQLPTPAGVTPLIGNFADQTEMEGVPEQMVPEDFTGGGVSPVTGLTVPPTLDPMQFPNDTLAEAQILGSIPVLNPDTGLPARDAAGNIIYQASVDGTLDNAPPAADQIDTYAVPFMAGVTFDVTLTVTDPLIAPADTAEEATVYVVDPEGRVIASNSRSEGGPLQVTTDLPGLYRFEVEVANSHGDTLLTELNYNLTVSNVGDMGIGGIYVRQDLSDIGVDSGIICGNGDLGALIIGDTYTSTTLGPTPTSLGTSDSTAIAPVHASTSLLVASGNLRVLSGNSLGFVLNGEFGDGPTLSVPSGSVGLIQAVGIEATNTLFIQTQYDPNFLELATPVFKTDDAYASAIGGSIEEIDAATALLAEIATNAGIGTIHAANMATLTPSHIDVNADNIGNDGIIDLIDVPGQFGVLGGGPEFVTNTGGNIRYLNVGGPIFLPTAFGGEVDAAVTYPVGSTNTFTDDSGAKFTITASGPVSTVLVNNSNGTTTQQSTGTQVTVLSYPVLDKAGQVPISITATTPSNVSAGSLTISGTGLSGPNSEVDVANISITGVGRPIAVATAQTSAGVVTTPTDAFGNTLIEQAVPTGDPTGVVTGVMTDPTDEFLSITGPAKFNVLNVTASVLPAFTGNSPVEISNTTQGEVVNVTAPDGIGSIVVDGNLGFSTPQATPAAVLPQAVIQDGNTYPFDLQHTGVVIGTGFVNGDGGSSAGTTGDVVSIQVGGAAGNIEAGGTIGSLIANAAQSMGNAKAKPILGQVDGIVGPVLATRLLYVDVGQGLLPSGSGLVGLSGLYATGKIGEVTNAGNPNGDIRGNIVSAEDLVDGETATTFDGIDEIDISSASIIGSSIATVADNAAHEPQFIETSDISPIGGITSSNGNNFAPGETTSTYDIGPIIVSGLGGIIGADIHTGSLESITVNAGGFGVFSTTVTGQNAGRLGSITASGYGIRDSDFESFGWMGPVTASGNGGLVPVTAYPIDVRPSDIPNTLDPYFGIVPDASIDLNAVLGTTLAAPNIANRTDTGVIENDIFDGQNDFASLTAKKARTTLPLLSPGTLPVPTVLNVPVIGSVFSNSITFGGAVGSINIKTETDGLQITAGSLASLSFSSSVDRVGISVAGAIQSLVIHGNLGEYVTDPESGVLIPDSYFDAGGPEGSIGSVKVYGNMNANIYATGHIGSILVTGDLLGGIVAFGDSRQLALSSLHVLGGIRNGALILNGNVGSIIVNGTLGTAAGSLTVHGSANLISVGADHKRHGSQMALALTVDGTLKNLTVFGSITGTISTGGNLNSLTVTDDGSNASAISGGITVGGRLGTATIANGNVASNIAVNNNIGSFTIKRGNLNAGISLQTMVGNLGNFQILGGLAFGAYGSILALESNGGSIDISGNLGDGVNVLSVTANSENHFRVRGSVAKGATVAVTGPLNVLEVDGSVLAGATISGHPIKKQKIVGTNTGVIIAV